IESGLRRASHGGRAIASGDLVREDHEQDVLRRKLLIVGEREASRQGVEHLSKAKALEGADEIRTHVDAAERLSARAHRAPPSSRRRGRVAKADASRAKRAGLVIRATVPSRTPLLSRATARLSIASMRRVSSTSNSSARAQ